MSSKYNYQTASFLNGLNLSKLHEEIELDGRVPIELEGVMLEGSEIIVSFVSDLSIDQKNDLDSILAAHTGTSTDPQVDLFPRLTSFQILDLVDPVGGDFAYATDIRKFAFFDSIRWVTLAVEGALVAADQGTGPAGTYTEDFEADLGHWYFPTSTEYGPEYTLGQWSRITGVTPSAGTGPVGAHNNSHYCYCEVSGGAHQDIFLLETSYFNRLLTVNFFYHMYGADMGTLELQTYDIVTNVWTTIWSVSGEQHNNANKEFTEVTVNAEPYNVSRLRFKYSGATNFAGDCCIDLVTITSE